MRLQVVSSNSTYYWSVTNAAPAKPYLQISNQYLPLTTATRAGIKLKVQSGNTTYRAAVYESGYYNTTSAAVGNLSSTTALTRASTSGTTYLTRLSTSGTNYGTRASTSATLTRASTSATLTRASTSATLTRASTSATIYLTRASTSGTNYGTKVNTVNYTSTLWNVFNTYWNSFGASLTQIAYYTHNYNNTVSAMTSYMKYSNRFSNTYYTPFLSVKYDDYNKANVSLTIPSSAWSRSSDHWFIAVNGSVRSKPTRFILLSSSGNATYTRTDEIYPAVTDTYSHRQGAQLWSASDRVLYFNKAGINTCPVYFGTQEFGSTTATTTGGLRKITIRNWLTMPYDSYSRYTSYSLQTSSQIPFLTYYNSRNTISWWYSAGKGWILTARTYYEVSLTAIVNSTTTTGTYTQKATTGTTYLTRASTSGTSYATRTSASGYATRSSISGYATRASTSGTTYLTRLSTSGTNYGTRASTSGYSGKLSSSKWG